MAEKRQPNIDRKQGWKQFINSSGTLTTDSDTYTYPVTESTTNDNVEKQDPGKQLREKSLYRKWLEREWQIAIDFGCGIGANFDCFDQQQNKSKVLIGLDPDRNRAILARDSAKRLKYVEAAVTRGDVSLLENSPVDLFADVILCSQVLGHVPRNELGRILRGFAAKLRTGGSCAVSIPVVGASFTDDSTAGGWTSGSDFMHLVYCNRSPFDDDYRMRVSGDLFDQYAARSPKGVLPVRNFWIPDFPRVSQHELPTPIMTVPPTLAEAIEPFFGVFKAVLYAIHGNTMRKTKEMGIGDALIILTKM